MFSSGADFVARDAFASRDATTPLRFFDFAAIFFASSRYDFLSRLARRRGWPSERRRHQAPGFMAYLYAAVVRR